MSTARPCPAAQFQWLRDTQALLRGAGRGEGQKPLGHVPSVCRARWVGSSAAVHRRGQHFRCRSAGLHSDPESCPQHRTQVLAVCRCSLRPGAEQALAQGWRLLVQVPPLGQHAPGDVVMHSNTSCTQWGASLSSLDTIVSCGLVHFRRDPEHLGKGASTCPAHRQDAAGIPSSVRSA